MEVWTAQKIPSALRNDTSLFTNENGIFDVTTGTRISRERLCTIIIPFVRNIENLRIAVLKTAWQSWLTSNWVVV